MACMLADASLQPLAQQLHLPPHPLLPPAAVPAQLSSLFFLMTSAYQLALILGMRSSVCMST